MMLYSPIRNCTIELPEIALNSVGLVRAAGDEVRHGERDQECHEQSYCQSASPSQSEKAASFRQFTHMRSTSSLIKARRQIFARRIARELTHASGRPELHQSLDRTARRPGSQPTGTC